jgi:acetolactate synthase-1/2/3 large subunit
MLAENNGNQPDSVVERMTAVNGAELLVEELAERGVEFVSTLCGHGLNPFYVACRARGLRLVDTRNEQAAAYMAEAYGRLSRRVGVCAVSSGVAHANALTGVSNAHFDGAPMLLLTGSGALTTMGLGHFQDLDQVAMAAPLCKFAQTVTAAERIPQLVEQAFAAATSGRPGPVHLTLPLDVQMAEVNFEKVVKTSSRTAKVQQSAGGDPQVIAQAFEWLREAERPLLVAGSGVFYAQGEQALAAFAERYALPVVVPIWDRGAVEKPSTEFVGVLGAATGGPNLLPDADLVILAGVHFDYRIGYLQPPAVRRDARVIRIDIDPAELSRGVKADLSIQADARSVLSQLLAEVQRTKTPPHSRWLEEAGARRRAFQARCRGARQRAPEGLHALDILEAIRGVWTDETVLLLDGGNIGQWAHQLLFDRYPGHWLTCGASAVVGYGLPAAMAARLHYPERPVILLSGDGALTFTIAELETATRQGLNFVVLLADDSAWGITLTEHVRAYGRGLASELGPVRFDKVAEGFGACGVRVSTPEELQPAIAEGLARNRPTLIHVPIVRSNPTD